MAVSTDMSILLALPYLRVTQAGMRTVREATTYPITSGSIKSKGIRSRFRVGWWLVHSSVIPRARKLLNPGVCVGEDSAALAALTL